MPAEGACTVDEKIIVTANPETQGGRPAQLDGPLRITKVSGEGDFAQDPANPNQFEAISGDTPGDTEYLVEGDADLGEGVTLIQDTYTLHVGGANAARFGLSSSSPVPK